MDDENKGMSFMRRKKSSTQELFEALKKIDDDIIDKFMTRKKRPEQMSSFKPKIILPKSRNKSVNNSSYSSSSQTISSHSSGITTESSPVKSHKRSDKSLLGMEQLISKRNSKVPATARSTGNLPPVKRTNNRKRERGEDVSSLTSSVYFFKGNKNKLKYLYKIIQNCEGLLDSEKHFYTKNIWAMRSLLKYHLKYTDKLKTS